MVSKGAREVHSKAQKGIRIFELGLIRSKGILGGTLGVKGA